MSQAAARRCGSALSASLCRLYANGRKLLSNLYASAPSNRHYGNHAAREGALLDAVMLARGLAFFAVAIAYVAACDRM